MRLAAAISFFNDCKSLKRTLDSLQQVDVVYCIDGRYPDFEADHDFSTDGSRELVLSYPNTVLIDCAAEEHVKRTRYCEACKEDYCLIIDSDEFVVEADWQTFKNNCEKACNDSADLYGVECYYNWPGRDFTLYPRLMYKPYRLEYWRAHNVFRNKVNGCCYRAPQRLHGHKIHGIRLAWDDSLRTKAYLEHSRGYQARLVEIEKPIRQALV